MEKYLVAGEEHFFYKRCEQYSKERKEVFKKAHAYMKCFGIKQDDVGLTSDGLYIIYGITKFLEKDCAGEDG